MDTLVELLSRHMSMSADEAMLDQLVQDATVPVLADLFQQAKDAGLIKPVHEYHALI